MFVQLKEITLGADELAAGSLEPGRYAMLSISDTGHGIAPDLMKKIFEPYFTTKEKGKGTGLGLALIHGIVKEHGGDIKVYSEVGKGATFNICLPLLERPAEIELIKRDSEILLKISTDKRLKRVYKQTIFKNGKQNFNRFQTLKKLIQE